MAETRMGGVGVWRLREEDIGLHRRKPGQRPLFLEIGDHVTIHLGFHPEHAAMEAEAMRKLAWVATEAADELVRRAAEEEAADG